MLDSRVIDTNEHEERSPGSAALTLTGGSQITADLVIWATSHARPATEFLPSEALDSKGFVRISNTYVMSSSMRPEITAPSHVSRAQFASDIPNASNHFAVGDVISTSGIRLAATAIRMARGVAMNIAQLLVAAEQGIQAQEAHGGLLEVVTQNNFLQLVIGSTAAQYRGENAPMFAGAEMKQRIFGDDMALHSEYFFPQFSMTL